MTDYELTTAKIRYLPKPLLQEVDDFVDFLLAKHSTDSPRVEVIAVVEHPIMAAFGAWQDDTDWDSLTAELYANRERQGTRSEVTL